MNKLPDITSDFAQWYQDVIYQAELVDQSPVRGSFVIRPYGWAIWENIVKYLDERIKATGHQNCSFPLFIPQSFLSKEAEHVAGFAPEVAVVTYAGGKQLEEPLIVRPTSETVIHAMFAKWMRSWRDLPIKVNQWANVVRWEMRPRAFLRTTEFFWQEGHTVHETAQEAAQEALMMLNEYVVMAGQVLAVPVIVGRKSAAQRFAGADETYTCEAIMPDGKALQLCTSHLLSQSFAKAFDMKFTGRTGQLEYPYLTSWGATTRMVGAIIMTHGDQKGLVVPPRIAPIQLVIVPIYKNESDAEVVCQHLDFIRTELENIRIYVDMDDHRTPGAKFYHWELRGVPVRLELGAREVQGKYAVLVNRMTGSKEEVPFTQLATRVPQLLDEIQEQLLERATTRTQSLINSGEKLTEFGPRIESGAGAFMTGWCQDPVCEQALTKYKASIRCQVETHVAPTCFACDKPSPHDVLVARSY